MRAVHLVIGWGIVGSFALLWVWGGLNWLLRRRRDPGRVFWGLLAFVQIALLVQLVAGLVLFAGGGRPPGLHYVYGIAFPVLVLGVAHRLAREPFGDRPWAVFAVAAFFAFGLTLRALTTGLGIG